MLPFRKAGSIQYEGAIASLLSRSHGVHPLRCTNSFEKGLLETLEDKGGSTEKEKYICSHWDAPNRTHMNCLREVFLREFGLKDCRLRESFDIHL
jgi:hypothetical protein